MSEMVDNKENVAPATSSDPLQRKGSSMSPATKKGGRRGRSKSIGPGSLDEPEAPKQRDTKDRRKSAFIPLTATKSILSKDEAAAKAARRKSMMNRRVSFAPEATLHTWDIIEQAQDQTTSTDSADSTRRGSAFGRSSASPGMSSDVDDGGLFTTSAQDQEDAELLSSPVAQHRGSKKSGRRSSGIPPMNFNNPDDFSSSGVSGSEESGSEDGEEEDDILSGDETGTAMSLDVDEVTMQSGSDASTSSSARLELALQQAAKTAGTRGIEYDEYGDMSMEIAAEEITNAFKPWVQSNIMEPIGSASLDQENVNPFSPAFKADIASRPSTIVEEEEEDDMSMDVTRAVGGILRAPQPAPASSPGSDATMDFTQAVGRITSQKRRRSTTETGSPGATISNAQSKRRRSSVARSSMGDDTMDLTMAVGGIKSSSSPTKPERRRSLRSRRSSGVASEADDATMEFTRAVGGIRAAEIAEDDSLVGNEELSMELTTVLGGIKNAQQPVASDSRPTTPRTSQVDAQVAANTTPKSQERFRDAPDLAATKLLTPLLQKQTANSSGDQAFLSKPKLARTPNAGLTAESTASPVRSEAPAEATPVARTPTPKSSPIKDLTYPDLPIVGPGSARARTPSQSPTRQQVQRTPTSGLRLQQDAAQQSNEPSPTVAKKQRSSPVKSAATTPEKRRSAEDSQNLTNTIKLMSTPRKETLKTVTPRKHTPAKQLSPVKAMTPRARPTPKGRQTASGPTEFASPAKRLFEDLDKIRAGGQPMEKIGLQDFLNQANIRFMDLTTTKRRMTTAPTPSKARRASNSQGVSDNEQATLENAVVAAACTTPELELYQHACHELKRYTKEGKQMIAELEASTLREQPPLIQAYVHATPERKIALDVQMRDMKTFARLQSKELWYEWRSQLLDELMVGLQNIGEGLIKDDEILGQSEQIVDQVLPALVEQHEALQEEADRLEADVNAVTDEEKEELQVARGRLTDVDADIAEKKLLLETLQDQVQEQDELAEKLQRSNAEFTAATHEANRVREACRGVSLNEITELKASVKDLEESFGWSIISASSSPATVTMTYKSDLELHFHPQAFAQEHELSNAPIRLTYIADSQPYKKKSLTTTLRFFLQLLQATLQGLPQCTTKIADLLSLVSNGWDTALSLAETERGLNLEALTETRILGDERLAIEANILLSRVRTKVRATFEVSATVGADLQVRTGVQPKVTVVYGEQYNEKNMAEFIRGAVGTGFEGWDVAVRGMREKLVARGPKGARK
ncbi:unnamed protein product [Zymoseptoria tritici ST99CH_3D1]|nr:unnamed protein product [Zymoseptoria tritici ST99CH_3D1]